MNDLPKIPERRTVLTDEDPIAPESGQTPLCMNHSTGLNDYHRQQSTRLAKKVSEQPLLSPEESMKQIQQLSKQSQRQKMNAGH